MGKKSDIRAEEKESSAAVRRKSFNTGDRKDAGPWSQDDQEDGQQC